MEEKLEHKEDKRPKIKIWSNKLFVSSTTFSLCMTSFYISLSQNKVQSLKGVKQGSMK